MMILGGVGPLRREALLRAGSLVLIYLEKSKVVLVGPQISSHKNVIIKEQTNVESMKL